MQTIAVANNKPQEHQTDFRLTWAGIIAGVVIVGGLSVQGYFKLSDRLDVVNAATQRVESRIAGVAARLEMRMEAISRSIEASRPPSPQPQRSSQIERWLNAGGRQE